MGENRGRIVKGHIYKGHMDKTKGGRIEGGRRGWLGLGGSCGGRMETTVLEQQ